MRFVTFQWLTQEPRPGLITGDAVRALPYPSLLEMIEDGERGQEITANIAAALSREEYELAEVRLYPPIPRLRVMRDFYAFEQHVRTANANRGRDIPPAWYEMPVFYYNNPNTLYGPEDVIPYPAYTQALDFELEIGFVLGSGGQDLSEDTAARSIFGYTIFNDWSARDEQRKEMSVGLGPAKGKDFASSIGPVLVTPDELAAKATGRLGVYDLRMQARINGQTVSDASFASIHYSPAQMIARASNSAPLQPGEFCGSGTLGGGCLLELRRGEGPWLQPGDEVELEIELLGILRNTIGQPGAVHPPTWLQEIPQEWSF